MQLNKLGRQQGIKKPAKRLGRGRGSGKGMHTVGRGQKGQLSRSGGKVSVGFEGGQEPLYKKIPQIGGFTNSRSKKIKLVSLSVFNSFRKGSTVGPDDLVKAGILRKLPRHGVKILSNGDLKKELKFRGFLMSKSAMDKIKKSGSKVLND